MKRLWIGLGSTLAITVAGTLIYIFLPTPAPASTSHAYEYYYEEENAVQTEPEDLLPSSDEASSEDSGGVPASGSSADTFHPQPVDTDPSSITVLINHLYTLPADYVPENLVAPDVPFTFSYMDDKRLMRADAAQALEELFAAADAEGIRLTAISGYRSYTRQNRIYLNNVSKKGKKYADQYSAPPGHSEHQAGLAMDISSASNHYKLTYGLADLPEGQWLKDNAHRFGYIIRYPEDKEAVTGYAYEPWHVRYVGTELAAYLYGHDLTLDEYYGVSAEEYEWIFDFDAAWKLLAETMKPTGKPEAAEPIPEEETEDPEDPETEEEKPETPNPDKDTVDDPDLEKGSPEEDIPAESIPEETEPEEPDDPAESEKPEENEPEENVSAENLPEDPMPEEDGCGENDAPVEGNITAVNNTPAENNAPESGSSSGL